MAAQEKSQVGADPPDEPDTLYATRPPWEIGRAQPALAALIEAGQVRGRVLDAGCGTGELALLAAAAGCDVTGVDLSEVALGRARAKAAQRALAVRFVRGDLQALADLAERFDVVLDSLVFHGFHGAQRTRYLEAVGSVLEPGGRMFVLCFAEEPPNRPGRVHTVAPEQLEAAFADGWRIDAIDAVTVASALESLPDGLRGWRAAVTRI